MADTFKTQMPPLENRKTPLHEKWRTAIAVLGILSPVIMFIVFNYVTTPSRTMAEKVSEMEPRVRVLEVKREADDKSTSEFRAEIMKRLDGIDLGLNKKIDNLIQMHMH